MREIATIAENSRVGRAARPSGAAVEGRTTGRGRAERGRWLRPLLTAFVLLVGLIAPAAPVVAAGSVTAGKPTISGVARVGSTLTARPGTWKPSGVELEFQWYRNGKAIAGADSANYALTAADKGKRLTVKVTGTLAGGDSKSRVSKRTGSVAAGILKAAVPKITGDATVGSTLTAAAGAWEPENVTFRYRWYRSGKLIKGATGIDYAIASRDAGKRLTVKVTGSLAGYRSSSKTSKPTREVEPGNDTIPITATPTIKGELAVGSTLTAEPGEWSKGTTFSHRWLRDGDVIEGAEAARYKLTAADEGKRISVELTGTLAGHPASVMTSASSLRVLKAYAEPGYGGDIAVGRTIEAQPGAWTQGTNFSYQWLRNGAPISRATADHYTLAAADADEEIGLIVTGSIDGYATISRTSPLHFRAMIIGTPTISGTPRAGATLTVDPGTWSAATTQIFQWWRDDSPISGATQTTYSPTAADVGKRLWVEMLGYASGYASIGTRSAATEPVTAASLSASNPTLSGDVRVGGRLSANPGAWGPEPVSLAYQWLMDGSAVSGATGQTWVIPTSAAGRVVSVRVTGTKAGYDSVSRTSATVVVHNVGERLTPGMRLRTDDFLLSSDGRFQLIMQGDGNLVLYQLAPRRVLWATNTGGAGNWAILQTDGNLVVYTAAGAARWGSATDRKPVRDLVMQSDGNLVIYQTDGRAIWASNTNQNTPPNTGGPIGDNYPANLKAAARDALVDPWNFYNRECTSFVAWRLNSANGVGFTNQYKGVARWGNAKEWGGVARSVGIPVNGTPARGAVAWSSAGEFGHVAWVAGVNGDGTITIEEYNYNWTGNYNTRRVSASAFQYIHIKDL